MKIVSFADVAYPEVSFRKAGGAEELVLKLIDSRWFQRLRDISQTANTRLVYMFSEHSRFGHCVGVAFLAKILMQSLRLRYPEQVEEFYAPILAAALLHDIGHLAPGSHTAYKTWFPDSADLHEEVSIRVLQEDPEIEGIFSLFGPDLLETTCRILKEDPKLPNWTWEILSGGGWNVDRGNWCVVDSVMAGVNYGQYNVKALTDSMEITSDGHIGIRENRLDAMMHFAISRHAMYRQVYQHRVLMSCDMINRALAARARDLKTPQFQDEVMEEVLAASSPLELSLRSIFCMRESWWRYHLMQWREASDEILRDLADRLLHRRLFKTVRVSEEESTEELLERASQAVKSAGLDPEYYLHRFSLSHMHRGESKHAMRVIQDDGTVVPLAAAEPLFEAMVQETEQPAREWLALPAEAKSLLGRDR